MKIIVFVFLFIPITVYSQETYQQEYSYRHGLDAKGQYLDSVNCKLSVMVDFKRNVLMLVDEKTKQSAFFEIKDFYYSKSYFHLFGLDKNGNAECTIDVYTNTNYHSFYCGYKDNSGFKLTAKIQ